MYLSQMGDIVSPSPKNFGKIFVEMLRGSRERNESSKDQGFQTRTVH